MIKSLSLAAVFTLALSGAALAAPPAVTDRISGPDGGWDYLTFDAVRQKVYVARRAGVTVVDLGAWAVSTLAPDLAGTHIALPINDGKDLLVTVGSTGEAVIVDAASGAVKSRTKTGSKPDAAVYDAVSGLVWVMDNHGAGVALIDPKTGASVGGIPVSGALEFAVSDGAGKVFANIEDANELVAFDARSRTVIGRYKLGACDGPTGLAYDADDRRLIAACANKLAEIVAADTGAVVASVAIGSGPDAAVYDATAKLAYVPTGRDGKLTAINMKTGAVVATGETALGARTAALDPATGKVYLATAKFAPPAAAGGKPAAVPGSFTVLVVSTR